MVAAAGAATATGSREQGHGQQQASSTPASTLTATVLASAAHAALRFTLSRARAAVLLLAHLESLGLLPAACLLVPPTGSSNSSHPSPHAAALALNRAWLLLATCSHPQLPPSPPRPPSPSSANQAGGGGDSGGGGGKRSHLTLHGKGLTVLEALLLQQGGGATGGATVLLKGWLAAGPASPSALPGRLLALLEGTDQWRYVAPWAQAFLHRALPSPAPAPSDADERMWERHIVYAHLSEARRHAAAQRPRAADAALGRAVACLRRWERCLCPLLPGEGGGMGEGEGPVDGGDVRQQRVAHYVQVGLVGLFG